MTTDDQVELRHELETFLKAYEAAANSRDFGNVAPLIADDATFWFTDGEFRGKSAVRRAFEATWANIRDEVYTLSDVQWTALSYWVSACTYKFKSDGDVDGRRQSYRGRGTSVLKRLDGSWRVVHEHLSG